MKITKYTHACVVLEKEGKKLIIDPGVFGTTPDDINNVTGIVITHNHGDHLDESQLKKIIAANPQAVIITTADTAARLAHPNIVTPKVGDKTTVGPFTLSFTGGMHALIYKNVPACQNFGVDVDNGTVYYPGDSFDLPSNAVHALLTPVSGPWLKMGEVMAFVETVKPKVCIPTHDGMLSDNGVKNVDSVLGGHCEQLHVAYSQLSAGQSLDLGF
ncbi:MAG TPA: MBL fold metallo-hydrolase [Bacillota bacterium]|nr:MBL fold metallo-hydrolase [Bacillota bacterium]